MDIDRRNERYDGIQPIRRRARADNLDSFWIIGFIFVGLAIIIWEHGTIESILTVIFVTTPQWLGSKFWSFSPPLKFFVVGMVILIPLFIRYLISEDSDRRRYYERRP